MWKKLRNCLPILIAIGCFIGAAYWGMKILHTELEYRRGSEAYSQLSGQIRRTKEETSKSEMTNREDNNRTNISDNEQTDESLNVGTTDDFALQFDELRAINADAVGWLYQPDTVIDYPIVQGTDNEYYLYHLLDGTPNSNGCLFVDAVNLPEFQDENTLIYGHHMQNGNMFKSITYYADQGYYESHPYFYLYTEDETWILEPFSGYNTAFDSDAYQIRFADDSSFSSWLQMRCALSEFQCDQVEVSAEDKIVTLSTCAYVWDNARFVLHCRMKRL